MNKEWHKQYNLQRRLAPLNNEQIEEFKSFIQITEDCHIWVGVKNNQGYGMYRCKKSHRIMYELNYGPIINKLFVLHSCDNPSCVKIEHLRLGTQKDNMNDKANRNRGFKRLVNKLNQTLANEIRNTKGSCYQVGRLFGVSASTVSLIRNNKIWVN